MAKLKLKAGEKYSIMRRAKSPRGFRYAVTNHGRIISFTTIPEEGIFLRPGSVSGYPSISLRLPDGGNKTYLIHRLVCENFHTKPDRTYRYVIHHNNKKDDNHYKNLTWATFEQSQEQMQAYRREAGIGSYKLTAAKVTQIKKILAGGKSRLKDIANRFGVSDMQIHRIKTGENWSHVK